MRVVREPAEQRRRHLCVAKHTGPFDEAQIGGDGAGSFVKLAQQVEQQRTACLTERQVVEFIN